MEMKQIAFALFPIEDGLNLNWNTIDREQLLEYTTHLEIITAHLFNAKNKNVNTKEVRAIATYVGHFLHRFKFGFPFGMDICEIFFKNVPDFDIFYAQSDVEHAQFKKIIDGWMHEYDHDN